jgi:DNA-binding winged helix-turn-helix (wHTH) protein/tetratricopeptide (TPR) repeat protein
MNLAHGVPGPLPVVCVWLPLIVIKFVSCLMRVPADPPGSDPSCTKQVQKVLKKRLISSEWVAMDHPVKHLLEFGPFRIDPEQRLLSKDAQSIPLSPKAFDLLLVLVQRGGRVVFKNDLMKLLWPDTFVEESNLAQHVFQIRKALGDRAYIVTVPGRGYRFAEDVRTVQQVAEESEQVSFHSPTPATIQTTSAAGCRRVLAIVLPVLVATAVGTYVGTYYYLHRAPKLTTPQLTTKDTVVLADFTNSTGDPVFDGALRQGLSAQLQQSPFLNLLPDERAAQTLSLMTRPRDAKLTPEVAREVCQRTASAAVLNGSIARIGTNYQLVLKATACATGDLLSSATARAVDKNHVLDALGRIASETRRELGESLASVQKYDVAPENVTTPSLEALRAYSLGRRAELLTRSAEATTLYQMAVNLDPNFAEAYVGLGVEYFNHDETSQAANSIRKAYQLRERASQREKLGIEVMYFVIVTGDCDAARKSLVLATQLYPRESAGFGNLGAMANCIGEYEQGLAAQREAMKLSPGVSKNYSNLLIDYLYLNRLQEAEEIGRQAKDRHLDSPFLHANLYLVEFLRHSSTAMQNEVAQVLGKPGVEDLILYYESDSAAYSGRFGRARELTRQAAESASRAGHREVSAAYEAEAALREALAGNPAAAKRQAKHALSLSSEKDVVAIAAIALALAGDSAEATRLGDDLGKRFPEDTPVQYNLLPAIRAATALRSGNASEAIASLRASTPYELGQTAQLVSLVLYPIYLRGDAYLAARDGASAAAEFQKILAHPGLTQNELIGPLALLGLGRAHVLSREIDTARIDYQNFLSLWKAADADVPVLKQARAEYAKLK